MPKYDHRCKDCGHEFEVIRKSHEIVNCPKCSAEDVPVFWRTVPILEKAKDPYDLLDGKTMRGSGKKIVSGPHYSSKTTV